MTAPHSTDAPLLSVVVCTYNREALLSRCLESLLAQDEPGVDYEILVVDNNCTDGTCTLVEGCKAQEPRLLRVMEPRQGLSHARNCGAAAARGRWLAYVDDDAMVPLDYVARCADIIARHAPDILGGPILPYYTTARPAWFRDSYEIRRHTTQTGFSATCPVSGSNFVIRREVLLGLGGFDPALGMQGSTPGYGEERKVLEAYRERTPAAEQKVYYDLDLPVYHHVPPHKLRRAYILGRFFAGGVTMCRLKGYGWREMARLLCRAPGRHLAHAAREIRQHGLTGADYLDIARHAVLDVGVVCQFIRSKLASAASRNTGDKGHGKKHPA